MNDLLVRVLTGDGLLRGAAVLTTGLAEETRRRQGTDPTATVALGRLLTGAALMASQLKGSQRLALMVEGNGPLQRLHAETDADGNIRASLKNPLAGLPPKGDRFDVAGAIGKAGFLHVVKDLGLKEPYRGMVQLQTSEVADDLAWYLTTSEQVPSTVALGVLLGREAQVAAAGGFLVQAMPGCDEGLLQTLEERIVALPPISTLLRENGDPEALLARVFEGIPYSVQSKVPLRFRCTCSRAQVEGMIRALGTEEIRSLITRPEATVVTCEFCREAYVFDAEALRALEG